MPHLHSSAECPHNHDILFFSPEILLRNIQFVAQRRTLAKARVLVDQTFLNPMSFVRVQIPSLHVYWEPSLDKTVGQTGKFSNQFLHEEAVDTEFIRSGSPSQDKHEG